MVERAVALLLAVAVAVLPATEAVAGSRPLTVVELFTSQGCSSCPPADALLGELAGRPDVLALSLHVDYWDYLGWKDPFASAAVSDRQRAYARRFGLRYVYTPQMVIQGAAEVMGADREKIVRRIAEAGSEATVEVAIRAVDRGHLVVSVGERAGGEEMDLWLVVFDDSQTTRIARGENRGRTLTYVNVVRDLARIGTWSGRAITIPVAMAADAGAGGGSGCAVLVQERAAGRILAAARLALAAN